MTRRSRSREVALQVLYRDDLNPEDADAGQSIVDRVAETNEFVERRLKEESLVAFANSLVGGVRRNRGELDGILTETAENWSLERMAVTDRNILRLGAFEILYGDTPNPVAINEAVELAKRYGNKQSAQFVNGVLDKLSASRDE
ncbi:MAG: transcription antitermination factor NusB [Pirellulales bacterium]|nr:transcription antitermination factor NusB [Pirellulales bacterium]